VSIEDGSVDLKNGEGNSKMRYIKVVIAMAVTGAAMLTMRGIRRRRNGETGKRRGRRGRRGGGG
jgi:hypothetical protein